MTTNRTHVLVLALRIVFAFLVASASGVGVFFLLFGLIPRSALATVPEPSDVYFPFAGPERPAVVEEKRRLAVSLGGALLGGALCMAALVLASKRWFPHQEGRSVGQDNALPHHGRLLHARMRLRARHA